MKLSNVRRLVAPITYMVLDIDDMIDVDTSSGGLTTLYIPNIVANGYDQVPKKIYINDVSNNASVGKITVVCIGGNTINNAPSIVLETNGVSAEIEIADRTRYLANLNTDDAPTPSGSSEIKIPTPMIGISRLLSDVGIPKLTAYYLPFTGSVTADFIRFAPKYYLFLAKKSNIHRKIIGGINTKVETPSGFYHPTHKNGINFPNGAFYSGSTEYPLNTEFPLTTGAYVRSTLSFNPAQWVRKSDGVGGWLLPTLADFGININQFKFTGKKGKYNKRVMNFKLAIGIRNPDKTSNNPIIFGELSETFRVAFNVRKISIDPDPKQYGFYGLNMNIQTTGLHRNK